MLKRLKHIIALAAFLAIPLGIQASQASAAPNCSPGITHTFPATFAGEIAFEAQLFCTISGTDRVDKVQFDNGGAGNNAYIYDRDFTPHIQFMDVPIGPGTTEKYPGGNGEAFYDYSHPDFCPSGSGTRWMYNWFSFRIHNWYQGTWGPWHFAGSPYLQEICRHN